MSVFTWIGIATVVLLTGRVVYFAVESVLVARIGWTRLEQLKEGLSGSRQEEPQ